MMLNGGGGGRLPGKPGVGVGVGVTIGAPEGMMGVAGAAPTMATPASRLAATRANDIVPFTSEMAKDEERAENDWDVETNAAVE
jgi:hypothetical protein